MASLESQLCPLNSARPLGPTWVPLLYAAAWTLFRQEAGATMGSPHLFLRDCCPALPEIQWLKTLVSNVISEFFIVSGRDVNPATSFGESVNGGEHV